MNTDTNDCFLRQADMTPDVEQIIDHLGVFAPDTLESWYNYFSTGKAKHFFALMQSLPSNNVN